MARDTPLSSRGMYYGRDPFNPWLILGQILLVQGWFYVCFVSGLLLSFLFSLCMSVTISLLTTWSLCDVLFRHTPGFHTAAFQPLLRCQRFFRPTNVLVQGVYVLHIPRLDCDLQLCSLERFPHHARHCDRHRARQEMPGLCGHPLRHAHVLKYSVSRLSHVVHLVGRNSRNRDYRHLCSGSGMYAPRTARNPHRKWILSSGQRRYRDRNRVESQGRSSVLRQSILTRHIFAQ
mmetsp:Transcript_9246/g.18830  ORF Transcript_9246/g.18830 Transcript_9246/m.18830 type:complete len:233 (-) Transcript_9246:17-715(-)